MDKLTFIALLKELDESDWQAIVDGGALFMVDDHHLEISHLNLTNTILTYSKNLDASSLRIESITQAEELLFKYYRTHPLSRKGFTTQAKALVEEYGGLAFASKICDLPERTFFVEEGVLIAESRASPRHCYGAFCELETGFDEATILARVEKWVGSGAAHERYLEMNVCRYTC